MGGSLPPGVGEPPTHQAQITDGRQLAARRRRAADAPESDALERRTGATHGSDALERRTGERRTGATHRRALRQRGPVYQSSDAQSLRTTELVYIRGFPIDFIFRF